MEEEKQISNPEGTLVLTEDMSLPQGPPSTEVESTMHLV